MIKKLKNNALNSDKYIHEGGEEPKKDEDYFTVWQGLKDMSVYSGKNILGALFHPTYMLVNLTYLGSVKTDPVKCASSDHANASTPVECLEAKTYLAAFGMGSSILGIIMLSVSMCFAGGLGQVLPQAYGSKEYKLCGAYLNRMQICIASIFIPLFILIELFIGYLMNALPINAHWV